MDNHKNDMWTNIENILHDLSFSSESVTKVKIDLENLAKGEITTKLLEGLNQEQLKQLGNQLQDKQEEAKQTIIQNFLRNTYSTEDISGQVLRVTQNLIKEYLEYLLTKVNDNRKKQILENLVAKV
ncbi:MAG: hypothetical protein WCO78_03465 [Candidatus Roizmanbacteria bacterium]